MIYPDFTKLILDYSDTQAMTFGQDSVQQGRLTRAQKTGKNGDRGAIAHGKNGVSSASRGMTHEDDYPSLEICLTQYYCIKH